MKIAAFYENIVTGAESRGIPVKEAVFLLMQSGLDLLYIGLDSLRSRQAELQDVIESTGLCVEGVHAWIDLGTAPKDPACEELIRKAADLGAKHALIVPGLFPQGESDHKHREANMIRGMRRVVAMGERVGVTVCMEDLDSLQAPYSTADGLDRFLSEIPGLRCCFDTGNLALIGEDELAAFLRFRDRLCAIHLKDRAHEPSAPGSIGKTCSDGSIVYPVPVGTGYIQTRDILRYLRENDRTCNGIVELYDYSPAQMLSSIAASIRWVKENI